MFSFSSIPFLTVNVSIEPWYCMKSILGVRCRVRGMRSSGIVLPAAACVLFLLPVVLGGERRGEGTKGRGSALASTRGREKKPG